LIAHQLGLPWRSENGKNNPMAQSTKQLEARLARVEKELAALKSSLAGKRAEPWYRQIVGEFAGDEAYAEIVRLGRLIRRGKLKG
jgi:hypothetical protein